MQSLYPLLSVASILVFIWLGRKLAISRNRNALGWGVAGAILPPVLFVLWRLKPLSAAEAAEDAPPGEESPAVNARRER